MMTEEQWAKFKRAEFAAAQRAIDKTYALMAAACRDRKSGKIDEATFTHLVKSAEVVLAIMMRRRPWT
jgi:hypothetical protein